MSEVVLAAKVEAEEGVEPAPCWRVLPGTVACQIIFIFKKLISVVSGLDGAQPGVQRCEFAHKGCKFISKNEGEF